MIDLKLLELGHRVYFENSQAFHSMAAQDPKNPTTEDAPIEMPARPRAFPRLVPDRLNYWRLSGLFLAISIGLFQVLGISVHRKIQNDVGVFDYVDVYGIAFVRALTFCPNGDLVRSNVQTTVDSWGRSELVHSHPRRVPPTSGAQKLSTRRPSQEGSATSRHAALLRHLYHEWMWWLGRLQDCFCISQS